MSVHLEVIEGLYFLIDLSKVNWERIKEEENIIVQSPISETNELEEIEGGRKAVRMMRAKDLSSFAALKLHLEEKGLNPAGATEMFALLALHDTKAILQGQETTHLLAPDTIRYGKNILMATVTKQWMQVGKGKIPYENYGDFYRIICIEN